jgi:16S rRNA (adenine1518-N6/adenine1519-N6)-dimethyltransferase
VFNQRRKMLRVSLRQIIDAANVPADFFEHELMTKRPEQLALQQFVELTNYVAEYIK